MRSTSRRAIGLLGIALMATQVIGANTMTGARPESSSPAFEQASPATPAQKEVNRLLKQIAAQAAVAGRHAGTLESFTRTGSRLPYGSHAAELTGAKEAINAMGADFRQLRELRPAALPWQQLVIDRTGHVLAGLAGQATAAIERLNEDRRNLRSPEYRDAVERLYAHASQARTLIAVNLDYAQAREKLNRLDAGTAEPGGGTPASLAATGSPTRASMSLEQRVRIALLNLPYYGVFDHLAFQIEADQVTLGGYASWPALRSDAERAVRGVEGVAAVTNTVEVLPLSGNDNRIRLAAYRAIYGHAALARYRLNPHPPIRIVVQNGHLMLVGVVDSDMDRTIAHLQAKGVPGAFSVTNNLQVGG